MTFSDKVKKLFGYEYKSEKISVNDNGETVAEEAVIQFPFIVQSCWNGEFPNLIQSKIYYATSEEDAVRHYVSKILNMAAFSEGPIKIKVFRPEPSAIYEVDGTTNLTKLEIDIDE